MTKSFMISIGSILLFTACVPANQGYAQTYEQQFNAAVAECEQGKLTRKTAVKRVDCVNQARSSMGVAQHLPYLGLLYPL